MSTPLQASASNARTPCAEEYFNGFELLYKSVENSIHKKMDIAMVLVHFVLIRHKNFRCVGLVESEIEEGNEGSELLPDGWNAQEFKYGLRYKRGTDYYKLLGNKSEELLIINLINNQTQKVSNLAINPETLVKETKGKVLNMIPEACLFADRIRNELLIASVFPSNTTSVTTQTTANDGASRSDPLRLSDPIRPLGQFLPVGVEPRPFGFPDVGRGDLDPLGRGGPGNLFPFPSHPDLRGAPPMPRFDPYGPPDRGVRPNPNPDHLQPPNYGGDHYYM